jgi:bifunctional polynucleotide phosphatase/kinase
MAQELGLPLTVYAACANDLYRKPRTGMWDTLCADFGLREVMQEGSSRGFWDKEGKSRIAAVLVGDAAGREHDHSDSDRHFCENLGIAFLTP